MMSCLVLSFSANKKLYIFLSGVLFSLAFFIRPSTLALIFVILYLLTMGKIDKSGKFEFRFFIISKNLLIFLLPLLILISIWVYRNYKRFNYFTISSSEERTWLSYYIETSRKPASFKDSHSYKQFLWQKYLEENPELISEATLKIDHDNPLFETKNWIKYQKNHYKKILKTYNLNTYPNIILTFA